MTDKIIKLAQNKGAELIDVNNPRLVMTPEQLLAIIRDASVATDLALAEFGGGAFEAWYCTTETRTVESAWKACSQHYEAKFSEMQTEFRNKIEEQRAALKYCSKHSTLAVQSVIRKALAIKANSKKN